MVLIAMASITTDEAASRKLSRTATGAGIAMPRSMLIAQAVPSTVQSSDLCTP